MNYGKVKQATNLNLYRKQEKEEDELREGQSSSLINLTRRQDKNNKMNYGKVKLLTWRASKTRWMRLYRRRSPWTSLTGLYDYLNLWLTLLVPISSNKARQAHSLLSPFPDFTVNSDSTENKYNSFTFSDSTWPTPFFDSTIFTWFGVIFLSLTDWIGCREEGVSSSPRL